MLVLSGVCRYLLHLGGRDVVGIDPTDSNAFPMHLQHDLRSPLPRHAEELLQHHYYELHRRVVIIQQHDLEHRWRLQLAALRLQYGVVLKLRHAALLRARALRSRTISVLARSRSVSASVSVAACGLS